MVRTRRSTTGVALLLVLVVLTVLTTQVPGARAASEARFDYRMMGNLQDSHGNGEIFAYDQSPTYGREKIDGQRTTVERFPEGGGFFFQTDRPNDGTYAIALLFRFDDVTSWGRVLGVSTEAGYGDNGLYVQGGDLVWWYNGTSKRGSDSVVADQWVQVVITRNAKDAIRVYLNGVRQLGISDVSDEFSGGPSNTFIFFRDNDDFGTPNEESSGAVKRIRQWESALSATAVAGLDRLPPKSRILTDRTSAARTSEVKATGRYWAPDEEVKLVLVDHAGNRFSIGSGVAFYDGEFVRTFTVPQFAATGEAKIVATGQMSKDKRKRALTVT